MANATSVSLVKKSSAKKMASAAKAGPAVAWTWIDNQDDSISVQGSDAGGNPVDISALATLTVSSSDPSIVSVDAPVGMTTLLHGLKPGHADITFTATFADGKTGPFVATSGVDVTGSAATGLILSPGTPVNRP